MNIEVETQVKAVAQSFCLDMALVESIVQVESAGDPYRARYEPAWSYLLEPSKHALSLGITEQTEFMFQSTSWGLMQVMGSVAREHGFMGPLPQLSDPVLGLKYGCLQLLKLSKTWPHMTDLVAAYNAGQARRYSPEGLYLNQVYVDSVMRLYRARVRAPEVQ